MATALAGERPAERHTTVTAGGTATGGAEPFGHRDRDALQAEQDAGEWGVLRGRQTSRTPPSAQRQRQRQRQQ